MNGRPQILVVSSDLEHRRALTSILNTEGWSPLQASRLSECNATLAAQNVSLIFCERRLADGTYRDLLPIAHTPDRKVPVVVTSRLADWDEYLEALRYGAVDLIASPCKPHDVSSAIAQAHREDQGHPTSSSAPEHNLRTSTAAGA